MPTTDITSWDGSIMAGALGEYTYQHQPYTQGIRISPGALQGGDSAYIAQRALEQEYAQLQQQTSTPWSWYTYTTTGGPVLNGETLDEYVEKPKPITDFGKWLERKYNKE